MLLAAVSCAANSSCNNEAQDRSDVALADTFEVWSYSADLYAHADMKYSFDKWGEKKYKQWENEFRSVMEERLGLKKIASQLKNYTPKVEFLRTEQCDGFRRDYYTIWTEPTLPLPIIVMIPDSLNAPAPLVIACQGHSKNPALFAGVYNNESERVSGEEGQRNIGIQAMKEGYICIVPTTRGFGETRTAQDKALDKTCSCRTELMHDLLVGRTPIGDRVWDVSRVLDWALEALPVDKKNLIVTGNSGGGTMALFAGAMDKRFTMSIPGSYFCTFTACIGAMRHCDCNYIPGILDLGEMYDIAGLTAPRHFRAIHGVLDNGFPIEGTRFALEKTQAIYKAAGAEGLCTLYEGPEGHRYYSAGAWDYIRENLVK